MVAEIDFTAGPQGWQGLEGIQGDLGPQGFQGVGFQGIQGIQGYLGIQGIQGVQGDLGIQGVQGTNPGPIGPQGFQGDLGIQGSLGIQGWQGLTGPQTDVYTLSAGRNNPNVTNSYLNSDETPTNITPMVLSTNATLVAMSIASNGPENWTAQVRVGNVLVPGASLASGGLAKAYSSAYSIDFSAGDGVQLYCSGTTINRPRAILWFKRR